MPNRRYTAWLPALLALCLVLPPVALAAEPRLVLLVVVDQLRGDAPWRLRDRFGSEGFNYLLANGTAFANAHYAHAPTMTAAGHATLMTGGGAAQHGQVANEWFDLELGQRVYSVGDPGQPLVGGEGEGRSPRHLESSTFGDELVLASGGRSRVFAVSIKDRAAVLMAGRKGKAYWYAKSSGHFVTSAYYHSELPGWLRRWNGSGAAGRYAGQQWGLLQPAEYYRFDGPDDAAWERPEEDLGRTFPHPFPERAGEALYRALPNTPMGDELTLAVVEALVAAERPGQGEATDLLAVSFSATDYIGHAYGPWSLEMEDNLLRLDRTLAALLALVDREVGLDQVLVVLASDHGSAAAPEYLAAHGFDAGRVDPPAMMARLNQALKRRFGVDRDLALAWWNPGIYLDLEAIGASGLAADEVERALAVEALHEPGIRWAFTRSDLLAGRVPGLPEAARVAAGFHPARSGNVIVVPRNGWYLGAERLDNAAMHGSPYAYDTHVPLMLVGPGIGKRTVYRPVAPRDLAPTLSAYLGVAPPSGSIGVPLVEIFE